MPEYLTPGVYVEETSFRPKSIEGVSTSTTAFVGPTRRGPISGTPEVITSFGEFSRVYGGLENLSFAVANDNAPNWTNYVAHAVRAFFDNGGARLYVSRTFVARNEIDVEDGFARTELVVDSGGATARFGSRMPGAAFNRPDAITTTLVSTPALPHPDPNEPLPLGLANAPNGSLARVGNAPVAQPATLEGGQPTFSLPAGTQLVLTVNGGAPAAVIFNGSSAEVEADASPTPIPVPAGTVLQVNIDGNAQSLILPEGNNISRAAMLDFLNRNLRGGYARLEGPDRFVIGSERQGSGSSVNVAAQGLLGFNADDNDTGAGNVSDLAAVTAAEIDALLTAGNFNVSASSNAAGNLVLATTTVGAAASLLVSNTPGREILGLPDQNNVAAAGDETAPQYYRKVGGTWQDAAGAAIPNQPTGVSLLTMRVEVEDGDGNNSVYDDIGFDSAHPRYIGAVLPQEPSSRAANISQAIWFDSTDNLTAFNLRSGLFSSGSARTLAMSNGHDGAEPGDVAHETALLNLEDIEDISIVAAPGYAALADRLSIQSRLVGHVEDMQFRFAILETTFGQTTGGALQERSQVDSRRSAIYYPWIVISNPLARPGNDQIPKELNLPPTGFIAGVYARTDIQRGVWKAPANEIVRGALRFEREINDGQQASLNPYGVNCLRYFFGRGNRVWGARTTSSDPEWKYVNIMRYFIYLERSIYRATQWAVFEPNGERLWANIRDTVSAFLYNEWRNGALLGATPEEAFFVRCDRSTMTQNDLDNGRLICEIGVAPLAPAEFVIFRIGQKTADARA